MLTSSLPFYYNYLYSQELPVVSDTPILQQLAVNAKVCVSEILLAIIVNGHHYSTIHGYIQEKI